MSLKNIILGIAIIILTISVAVYGIGTFYDKPEYEDFCGDVRTAEVIENQQRCEEVGGKWNGDGPSRSLEGEPVFKGFCDIYYTCRMEHDDALEIYSRNLFLIALPLGIVVIGLGALVFGLEAVGAGLMGGGVGIILYGVGGYWRFTGDAFKFIASLIGLVVLIYLSYYFNKKWHGKGRKN